MTWTAEMEVSGVQGGENREVEAIGHGPQAECIWKEEGERGVVLKKNTDFEVSRS